MGIAGAALLVLLVVLLVLPRVAGLGPVREKILSHVSTALGGEVLFEKVTFQLLPRPHLSVHEAKVSIPGKVSGTIGFVAIYPRILPLLAGRVHPFKVRARAPALTLGLPLERKQGRTSEGMLSARALEEQVAGALGVLAEKAPGLKVLVEQGQLDLSRQGQSAFWFHDIDGKARIKADRIDVSASCNSNLWKRAAFSGSVHVKDLEASGQLDLTEFRVEAVKAHTAHLTHWPVEGGQANLKVGFKMKGLEFIQAEISGSVPSLTFKQQSEKLVIKAPGLKGTFQRDENRSAVSLTALNLEYPRLSASGDLVVDRATPEVALTVHGRDVDAAATRKAAIALLGHMSEVGDIFERVRGGTVPSITVEIRGRAPEDLEDLDNLVIKGRMNDGNVFIPEADLDLHKVYGDAHISKGILRGTNLRAQLGNSSGSHGTLVIGLQGENAPFTLDIGIEADLAQLPPVLKRLVSDESFQKELHLIEDFQGKAAGRLYLGETTDDINPRVEASSFDVTSTYGRLPHPVKVTGANFAYEGSTVQVDNLSGRLENSSFTEVAARLDWGAKHHIEVSSGPSTISMGEIYPWLSSFDEVGKALEKLKSLTGTAELSALNLKGPLFRPEGWEFKTGGVLKNVSIQSDVIPETLGVSQAGFNATQQGLSVTFPPETPFTWGERNGISGGKLDFSSKELLVDMDLSTEALTWQEIHKIFEREEQEKTVESRERLWDLPVHGTLKVASERFEYEQFKWQPLRVDMTFTGHGLTAAVRDTKLCGISTPGSFEVSPAGISLHFEPTAKNEKLARTLSCLTDEERPVTGHFDLAATVSAKEQKTELVKSLEGKLKFVASDGRVYRYGAIAKILNLLNVEGVIRGQLPNIRKEGFPYQSIKAKGHLEKGKLMVDEGVLDSHSMNMVFEGHIKLTDGTMNMTVLVAPLKTADWVIEKIPVVNYILQGTLVTIPYRVTGPLADPKVTPLSPTAVASRLLTIMKRTVTLPAKVLEFPFESPEEKEKKKESKKESGKKQE